MNSARILNNSKVDTGKSRSFSNLDVIEIFHFLLSQRWKDCWEGFKVGDDFSRTQNKEISNFWKMLQVFTDSGLNVKEFFDPFSTKKFFLELKGIFHFIPSLRWEVALVYLKQSIGDNLIFCSTSKFQKLLKYAQNQRAKTIFVFFTKTYLLKQSIFFNILLKNRLVSSEENTEKKRNGIRERKESEFSLGL